MKKKISHILLISLIALGVFSSCEKFPFEYLNSTTSETGETVDEGEIIDEEEPTGIPITDYSLMGTPCQWLDLDMTPHMYGNNIFLHSELVVINSIDELTTYLNCTEEIEHKIDFSTQSILLIQGEEPYIIGPITTILQHNTTGYELRINLHPGLGAALTGWRTVIITPKINHGEHITLHLSRNF